MDKQDRRWPGVNGNGPWRSPSSPPSASAAALIPGDQTQLGDICSLTDVFFIYSFATSDDVGGGPTAMDYP